MVPLREAAKENGYTVKWQGKQKPIVLEKDGTSIEITLGSAEYVVEGDMVMKAAMPSELKDGKTYVSARFLINIKSVFKLKGVRMDSLFVL